MKQISGIILVLSLSLLVGCGSDSSVPTATASQESSSTTEVETVEKFLFGNILKSNCSAGPTQTFFQFKEAGEDIEIVVNNVSFVSEGCEIEGFDSSYTSVLEVFNKKYEKDASFFMVFDDNQNPYCVKATKKKVSVLMFNEGDYEIYAASQNAAQDISVESKTFYQLSAEFCSLEEDYDKATMDVTVANPDYAEILPDGKLMF